MTSDYLTGLANQIQDKYGTGDTSKNIYNVATAGTNQSYSQLGDYSGQFNQNIQRRYNEEGYLRLDPFNVIPKEFEALLQEPDAVILLKKRAFSTLAESYRSDVMDNEEKLYLKATKILFQNKCNQISAMEKLTKIARVTSAVGQLDDQLMPLIINLVDNAANNFASYSPTGATLPPSFGGTNVGGGDPTAFQKLATIINQIRKIYAFSPVNPYTTWISDLSNPFQSALAQGTGVIELTNVTNLTTTTTVDFNSPGQFSLTINDPYGLMRVTDGDIEWALSDSLNFVANQKLYQQGQASLQDISALNVQQLNAARTERSASIIQINSDPNTIIGNLVTAIITSSGEQINYNYNASAGIFQAAANSGVTVSTESLIGGPDVGNDGLNPEEVNLFSAAIISTFAALNYVQSAASTVFTDPSGKSNLDINYVRNKLRFHYGNKLIAQPMDRIHIYVGSKSRTDNQIMTGITNMFSGLGYLQNLNTTAYDIKNQFNNLFNPSANIDLQLEKSAFVGPDFPNGLWALMRNTFVSDKSGTHIFAGLVTDSSQMRTPGKFSVSVTGKDNTHFFDLGVINLDPGVDNFVGPLYDPLTPFKNRFDVVTTNFKDQIPEFLDENKVLLSNQTWNKGLIKFTSGRYAGQPATQDNIFQDSQITKDGSIRNVIHGLAGLIYKWKEGIGTFTYNADSYSANDPERIGIPSLTNDPFAGQDIMNTLSLLITGTPYNYATYYKAVSEFDQTSRDPQTGQDPAMSFYNALSTTLQKNDLLWGGFVPFKNLVIDEASQLAQANQLKINDQNNIINNQLQQIQSLKNTIFIQQAAEGPNPSSAIPGLQTNLQNANAQLAIQIATQQANLQLTVPITNPAADTSYSPSSSNSSTNPSDPAVRAETRRLTNFLTRRLSWAVRANEDKNLLIIDDSYDKDYDILAYEKSIKSSISQFNSEYTTVRQKIASVSSLLNLEVFCDTQGHIRIRPQQYNKVPSSIFYRMMQLKYLNGIQIFPKFLSDLYINQINSLTNNLEILEEQIRLDGAYIGINNDGSLEQFIGGGFTFFSDQYGNITSIDSILSSSNPDSIVSNIPQAFVVQIQGQSKLTSVFNSVQRAQKTQTVLNMPTIMTTPSQTYISSLITIISQKSGQQVTPDNFVTAVGGAGGAVNIPATNVVDVVKVTQDLSNKINQRQQLIKSLSSSITNAQEFKSLDTSPTYSAGSMTNQLLSPQSYGNKNIPAVFQHMIEDETNDDYGPGSGKRYVIRNYQVLQINISETPPEFTALEVQGQLDPFVSNNILPFNGSGQAFPQGGNAMITAAAIDYDLWRMYGFRTTAAVAVPFLSNPESQCAPYAVSILTRVRKEILQGTITIAGNEFMQPGEVVYIEDMGLLFYIHSVSHTFSFGGKFTTTLVLKYGHNPGEYIPTPLDIIGKALYNNRDISGNVNYRQTNVFNESSLGAIIIRVPVSGTSSSANSATSTAPDPYTLLTGGNEGNTNLKVISNALYSSTGVVATNSAAGSNVNVNVELRIFYDGSIGPVNSTLSSVRDTVKSVLTGVTQIPSNNLSNNANKISLPASVINLANIDISNQSENRSPSNRAVAAARNILTNNSGLTSTSNPLYAAMFQCVIDCVITFNSQAAGQTSQAVS
jgi:hypothetical protein